MVAVVFHWEVDVQVIQQVVVSELVAGQNLKLFPVDGQKAIGLEVSRGDVVLLVHLTGLIQRKLLVEFLPFIR